MLKLELHTPFAELWCDKDPFLSAFALNGEVFRKVKSRCTFRIEENGKGYFVKLHSGTGWWEILKNLFQLKLPILGAGNEYRALKLLNSLNIPTMTVVAYGENGLNPANRRSFLITDELTEVTSLEDLMKTSVTSAQRHRIITALADNTGAMHRAGINHRDCYICHFLLDTTTLNNSNPCLYIIDLHRAQIRKKVPYRYLVKDVAGLYFSAMDSGLTSKDVWRFLRIYHQHPLKKLKLSQMHFWLDVKRTGEKLYQKEFHRQPPAIF